MLVRNFSANIQEEDLRKIERELQIIDKVEAKRKVVWKAALKVNVEKEVRLAIRRAITIEELDTIREPFSATDENKKSKVQLALEKGLGPLGEAIVKDDMHSITRLIASYQSSEDSEEIRESGIILAAESIFRNYSQVCFDDFRLDPKKFDLQNETNIKPPLPKIFLIPCKV